MSSIIRAVRSSFLPPPPETSTDATIPATANTYRLAQIAIEAAERMQQNQVNRMIRAGRAASPISATPVRTPPALRGSNFVINLPIN